ncbi:hypothetical protein GOV04_04225 [Candidatus Woesearchaeota archaeon]|nr:hypothetical protein [Candidatus Woesearchaeota archaeon]
MKKRGIHGAVLLIIGLIVTGLSWWLNIRNQELKLLLFVVIGSVMALYGAIKLLFVKKVEEKVVSQSLAKEVANEVAQQKYKHCPTCKTTAHHHDGFCRKCGRNI